MGTTILLTGRPGCGKTTTIRKVLAQFDGPVGGFFTQEIRPGRVRTGFELITLTGARGVLAHTDFGGEARVGKYGVDLGVLDSLGVAAVRQAISTEALVVIDEIGPMEILSRPFRQVVLQALESDAPVLGSIAHRPLPFIEKVRSHPDVRIVQVTPANRDELVAEIIRWLPERGRSAG